MMVTVLWEFTPLDTLFFRGAAPFNAGEGGQGGQNSIFPPSMTTLQGAIRYQLALRRGWKPGAGNFPVELGDNDDLGDLKLCGPYLYYDNELLLPVPQFLLRLNAGKENPASYHRLFPGKEVCCDLGQVRLPVMPSEATGAKSMENYWLTVTAMERTLAGGIPENKNFNAIMNRSNGCIAADGVVNSDQLWKNESKVGIMRQADTRIAKDKNLYAINMIRTEKPLKIVVGVGGISEKWNLSVNEQSRAVNLGGEGKLAGLNILKRPIKLPNMQELKVVNGKVRFTVTLITQGYFGNRKQTQNAILTLKPWINHTCITACVGKVQQIGGWDLSVNRPRSLRAFIPAGSSWFFEGNEAHINEIAKLHGQYIGKCSEYGYGQILIGRWEEKI